MDRIAKDTARICAGLHEEGWRLVLTKLDPGSTDRIRAAVAEMFEDRARAIRSTGTKAMSAVAGDFE
jgi:hypothetical protein